MKKWIELIGDGIIIAFGVMSFMIFMTIVTQGYARLVEPTHWIIYTELGLAFGAMIIGIERTIDDVIRYFGKGGSNV